MFDWIVRPRMYRLRLRDRSRTGSKATIGLSFLAVALLAPAGASAHFTEPPAPASERVSAGGAHSCAIGDDGTLACWGDDSAGQLDEVPTGEFLSVSAGGTHTCAIRADATLACWGDDSAGQLDEVPAGEFLSVSAGGNHTCAIRADATLTCWGEGSAGQLDEVPTGKFAAVSAGGAHTCAIKSHGDLLCWGDDADGQVSGAPSDEHHFYWPFWFYFHHHHPYRDDLDFDAVAAGGSHSCAIDEDGALACWGDDSAGQLDEIPAGEFASLSAGGGHTCAIRDDATLACWGDDSAGQLDEVPEGEFDTVSAGGSHTCAAATAGGIACWGDNEAGQVQPSILPPAPPSGKVGTPYSHQFETTPQSPLPTYSLSAGKLPDGLQLAPDGALTGTPAKAGSFAFTVSAANGLTPDATLEVTLTIAALPPAPAAVAQVADPGLPPPTAGVNFNLEPVDGVSKVKCADEAAFGVLTEPKQVPIDCQVDTSQGVVKLTSSTGEGAGTQSAFFWAGAFTVSQQAKTDWITEMHLAGRLKCERRKLAKRGARASRRNFKRGGNGGRKLWGSGKGNFKTSGNYGSATVRGTVWLVRDRCDNSTLFGVREGIVTVEDFVKEITIFLKPGHRYVAKASIPRLR